MESKEQSVGEHWEEGQDIAAIPMEVKLRECYIKHGMFRLEPAILIEDPHYFIIVKTPSNNIKQHYYSFPKFATNSSSSKKP